MQNIPPLNALRTFVAAGTHLNMVKAAEELGVSPGAVSQQIRILEKWMGSQLFTRTNKGLLFTISGQKYFIAIKQAFGAIQEATSKAGRPSVRGTLTIATTGTFAMKWLLHNLSGFRQKWPGLEISITTTSSISQFSPEDGDLAIVYGDGGATKHKYYELTRDKLIVVGSPKLVSTEQSKPGHQTIPKDIPLLADKHPNTISGYPDWKTLFPEQDDQDSHAPSIRNFSEQWMVIEAAIAGDGIGLVKEILVQNDIKEGKLLRISHFERTLETGYFLACLPENTNDPAIRSFRQWITKALK